MCVGDGLIAGDDAHLIHIASEAECLDILGAAVTDILGSNAGEA